MIIIHYDDDDDDKVLLEFLSGFSIYCYGCFDIF